MKIWLKLQMPRITYQCPKLSGEIRVRITCTPSGSPEMEDSTRHKQKGFLILKWFPKEINTLKQEVRMFLKALLSHQRLSSTELAASRQTSRSPSHKIWTVLPNNAILDLTIMLQWLNGEKAYNQVFLSTLFFCLRIIVRKNLKTTISLEEQHCGYSFDENPTHFHTGKPCYNYVPAICPWTWVYS